MIYNMIGYSIAHICVFIYNTAKISRQIVSSPFLLSRNMFHQKCRRIHAHSSSVPLSSEPSSCPFEGYLLPSSEIHEIPRNPNAQFSASIFSGIQSTYVSSSCSPCNMCACTCKCMPIYTCKRVRTQSSEWKRRGMKGRMSEGKLQTQWG